MNIHIVWSLTRQTDAQTDEQRDGGTDWQTWPTKSMSRQHAMIIKWPLTTRLMFYSTMRSVFCVCCHLASIADVNCAPVTAFSRCELLSAV